MRIYISGPITGREEDARNRFRQAEEEIVRKYGTNVEMINPYEVGSAMDTNAALKHHEYMHISFALIDLCDAVYFMDGWEESNGCMQEWIYAKNRIMKVVRE